LLADREKTDEALISLRYFNENSTKQDYLVAVI